MTTTGDCPGQAELEQWISGLVSSDRQSQLELHLQSCKSCRSARDRLKPRPSRQPSEDTPSIACEEDLTPPPIRGGSPPRVFISAEEAFRFLRSPLSDDEIGRMGGYRILSVLGIGGMGIVFQAEEITLNRLVALKVMKPVLAAHESAVKRFLREARAAAAISSDHVVKIYQVGEESGLPFIAMEFLPGTSLEQFLKTRCPLSIREALTVAGQIAAGLEAAHEAGLIHRDVTPANALLVPLSSKVNRPSAAFKNQQVGSSLAFDPQSFRVKLLDFGLVRAVDGDESLSRSGMIAGTPQYMSPEQAEGREIDHRSDFFSLGCILYRMLSGSVPFPQKGNTALLLAISAKPHAPLSSGGIEIPLYIESLVDRLLAKDPNKRFQTAGEIREALDDALENCDRSQRLIEQSRERRKPRLPVRSFMLTTVLAAVTACLAIAVVWFGFQPALPTDSHNRSSTTPQTQKDASSIRNLDPVSGQTPSPSLRPNLSDRDLAVEVLKSGGSINVDTPGVAHAIKDISALPQKDFQITSIALRSGSGPVSATELRVLPELRHGVTLHLSKRQLTMDALRIIARSPVGVLDADESPLDDEQLGKLAVSSSAIHWLQIRGTKITSEGLKSLHNLPALRLLAITAVPDDKAVKSLISLKHLEQIGLTDQWLRPQVVDRLIESPIGSLEAMGIIATVLTPADIESLARFRKLKTLTLRADIQAEAWSHFKSLTALRHLYLENMHLSAEQLRALAETSQLESISFFYHDRPQSNLEELCLAESLKSVAFLGPADLISAGNLHRLRPDIEFKGIEVSAIPPEETPDQRAASFALALSGNVSVVTNEKAVPIFGPGDFPSTPWHVTGIEMTGTPLVNDRLLELLHDLPRLSYVDLNNSRITSRGVEKLKNLPALRSLFLHSTAIDDRGMAHLNKFPTIELLHIEGTKVSDAGISTLRDLNQLTFLNIGKTQVSGKSFPLLATQFPRLETLLLPQVTFENADLASFRQMKFLKNVGLDQTNIGDQGLAFLTDIPSITQIGLSGTQITPAAIPLLARFKSLRRVYTFETSLSEVPYAEFRRQLPRVEVVYDRIRASAEFCFGDGRSSVLTLKTPDGKIGEVRSPTEFPDSKFQVLKIDFSRSPSLGSATFWHLRALQPDLQSLNLTDSSFFPGELANIAPFSSLVDLDLTGVPITDRTLLPVYQMKSLRHLNLTRTRVTAPEISRLKSALPDCKIIGP